MMTGCLQATTVVGSISANAGHLVTNGKLAGIRLGMSYNDLKLRRPSVRPALYVGVFEQLGSDTIWYHLDPMPREPDFDDESAGTASGSATVVAVELRRVLPGDSVAKRQWQADVKRIAHIAQVTFECFTIPRDQGTLVALASRENAWVGILQRPEVTMRGSNGAFVYPPSNSIFASSDPTLFVPADSPRHHEECPAP